MVSWWGLAGFLLIGLSVATPASGLTRPESAWRDDGRMAVADASSTTRSSLLSTNVTCPLDFSFLNTFTWVVPACSVGANKTSCCSAAFYSMGLAVAKYLNESGFFELPDVATATACLNKFQALLKLSGVHTDVVGECFEEPNAPYPTSKLIRSKTLCRGIETVADFKKIVGVTPVDTSCRSNLINRDQCDKCVHDVNDVINSLFMNSSARPDCFDFGLIYAAGVINDQGPWDVGTATCLLAVQYAVGGSSAHTALYIGLGAGGAGLVSLVAGLVFWIIWRRKRAAIHRDFVARNNKMLKPSASALVWFEGAELKSATDGFSKKNLLGEGGYGCVYKGLLKDGRPIAIKRFRNCTPEGDADFLNEVEVISKVRHRNLVVLKGCCVASSSSEGHQRMLVYDFMHHGSLADYLRKRSNPVLEWPERRKIGIGVARGLAYLHSEVVPRILHRDIKASNILLDEHFNARVADFGLAKLAPEDESHFTTHVAGTHGYLAPEYALYGQLTEKSDVYSFGVCLLELLSGRPALAAADNLQMTLVTDWAWLLAKEGRVMDIVEESIRNKGPQDVMQRFVMVGILCAHLLVAFRPTMTEALRMLEGDCDIPMIPDRPLPLNQHLIDLESSYSYSAQSTPTALGQRELLR